MKAAWIVPGGHARICVEGVLDFDSVAPLLADSRRRFAAEERLEIDLRGVCRANSAGLALLLEWVAMAKDHGTSLRLLDPPGSLMRLAAITNVTELLPVDTGT